MAKVLSGLGVLDEVKSKVEEMSRIMLFDHADNEYNHLLIGDMQWEDLEVEMTLDSGCVDHVMDEGEAPGYCILQSRGSLRKQNFIVGNGAEVPNRGEIHLNLEAKVDGVDKLLQSTFQVAKITRPLMSVSRICDQGLRCLFDNEKAAILNAAGETVCEFKRRGGLYVACMKLKKPNDDKQDHDRALPFRRQSGR